MKLYVNTKFYCDENIADYSDDNDVNENRHDSSDSNLSLSDEIVQLQE